MVHGIPINIEGSLEDIIKDYNFAAIDGSSTRIKRLYFSAVPAQAAAGFYSYKGALPNQLILNNGIKYVVFAKNIVNREISSLPSNIAEFNKAVSRDDNIATVATKYQAEMEVSGINALIDDYPEYFSKLNFLGIDGPLYHANILSESIKTIKRVIDAGLTVFSIVKRSYRDTYYRLISEYNANPIIKIKTSSYIGCDREFLGIYLRKGHYTPFYRHVTRYEFEKDLPEDMYRMCTYVKLASNFICRVEIPQLFANQDDQLNYASEIVSIVYKLSAMNNGKLPFHFDRADKSATISDAMRDRLAIYIDNYLKSLQVPYGDQDNWK